MSIKTSLSNSFERYVRKINKKNILNVDVEKKYARTISEIKNLTNAENSETFYLKRQDDYEGIFSTSQLTNLDFSKFENHVFFDSAVDKTNYAFKKIINEFPYDKPDIEYQNYLNNLDGYSNHILKNVFPKSINYLNFKGNNYVKIEDITGVIFNDVDKKEIGTLDPKLNNFSFDFWLYVEDENVTANHIIFQKYDSINNEGFTCFISKEYEKVKANFLITSENELLISSFDIKTNVFCNVVINVFSQSFKRKISAFVNCIKVNVDTTGVINLKKFKSEFSKNPFYIGYGENHDEYEMEQFIGKIDEFKYFNKILTQEQIVDNFNKNIQTNDYLLLYLRFNEPKGTYTNNFICIDHSGKKLHGIIMAINSEITDEELLELRDNEGILPPLLHEKSSDNPVLFSTYPSILYELRKITVEAEKYDAINPNVIWNLFPQYIFAASADFDGINNIFMQNKDFTINKNKIDTKANTTFVNLILIWARFFDQIKCYIDSMSEFLSLDYDSINKEEALGIILPIALKNIGFEFEEIFKNVTIDKLEGRNLQYFDVNDDKKIRQIQNTLWKRLLINSQDILKSKGTISSIRSTFNSFGIDVDKFIDIREYSALNIVNYNKQSTQLHKSYRTIDFGNIKYTNKDTLFGEDLLPTNKPLLYINNIDDCQINLGCCFSYEAFYRFNNFNKINFKSDQSLIRLSYIDDNEQYSDFINLVFNKKSEDFTGDLILKINNNLDNSFSDLKIENVDLFSGDLFYICIIKDKTNEETSKYKLIISNCCNASSIGIKSQEKEIYLTENINITNSYMFIGPTNLYEYDNTVEFQGEVSNIRLWNKALSKREIFLHKKDLQNVADENILEYKSVFKNIKQGLILNINLLEDLNNYNQIIFEKNLPLFNYILGDKINPYIYIYDSTEVSDVIKNTSAIILRQNIKVDNPSNFNKININSYKEQYYSIEEDNFNYYDLHTSKYLTSFNNENRLDIDFSMVKILNEDISKIIDIYSLYSKYLADSSNIYAYEYKILKNMRDIYFDTLNEKINFKPLLQVYKYFENITQNILFDIVPDKVNYSGFNFIVESHILERHKYEYKMSNSRIEGIDISDPEIYKKVYSNYNTFNRQYSRVIK